MNIESKYNLGDKVYCITRYSPAVKKTCTFCEGQGIITGSDGSVRSCPECYGDSFKTSYQPMAWYVSEKLTIGQVRVEVEKKRREEIYMCVESGIGSGFLHHVDTLWPSVKEAEEECAKRNNQEDK